MNEITRIRRPHGTTQAADGLPRLKWTLEEFEELSKRGFFGGIDSPRERVELVDGDLVPMQSKGGRHERVRGRLLSYVGKAIGDGLIAYSEPGWRPGGDFYFEPEIIISATEFEPDTVAPEDVLLLIEVSDTTFRYDEVTKARYYAAFGVREYWIVEAKSLVTSVHREPSAAGYRSIEKVGPSGRLAAKFVPELTVSMADLGIR
ncbi:MAG: Uma2 family endonuclease [Hyphomicrobium sp.]